MARRRLTRWMVEDMIRLLREDADACILLNAAYLPESGYPRVHRDGKRWSLHRYLYYRVEGVELEPSVCLLPGGCTTKGCLNPYHHKVSRRRGVRVRTKCPNGHDYKPSTTFRTGRYRCAICVENRNARRRKSPYPNGWCRKGHRISGKNELTYRKGDGTIGRRCRQCHIERQRAYRRRKRNG